MLIGSIFDKSQHCYLSLRHQSLFVLHQSGHIVEVGIFAFSEARINILEPKDDVGHDHNHNYMSEVEQDVVHTNFVKITLQSTPSRA